MWLCLLSVAISLAMVPYAWDEFTPASVYGMRSADGNQTSMSRRIGDN